MFYCNRMYWILRAKVATVLCAALVTELATAATPRLQSIVVTPSAPSISVGQTQSFTATGTFSNGTKQALGPAMADVAAGLQDTCALLRSGAVECWGANYSGQHGDGTTTNSRVPRLPVVGINNATQVTLGWGWACARLATGAINCWGANGNGQLGNGGAPGTFSTTPVKVRGISTATTVAAGGDFTCALLANGTVWCWGYNGNGELGNGTTTESSIPVQVAGINTAVAIGTGYEHGCAVLASGAVQCWGQNSFGALGNGSTTDSTTPVTVVGLSSAQNLAAGVFTTCALLTNGTERCWGDNFYGELGDGSAGGYGSYSTTPTHVKGISSGVAIIAGGYFNCVLLRGGTVQCWGDNRDGVLGTGGGPGSNVPVSFIGVKSPTRLAGGYSNVCTLFSGDLVTCWGGNQYGQLGNGHKNSNPNPSPTNVIGTPGVVWASSNTSKATIDDHGVATGHTAGDTTITATTAGFINDNALLTVK
jgi:Regulator of chromosome condensation (RCC1) repeat/Bacterial Ig-like domain (group 2)